MQYLSFSDDPSQYISNQKDRYLFKNSVPQFWKGLKSILLLNKYLSTLRAPERAQKNSWDLALTYLDWEICAMVSHLKRQ